MIHDTIHFCFVYYYQIFIGCVRLESYIFVFFYVIGVNYISQIFLFAKHKKKTQFRII